MSQPAGEDSVFHPSDSPDDAVTDAVARYIDDLTAGREVDPSRVLVENPGIGHEVLARIEGFVGLRDKASAARDLGALGDYTIRRQIGRGGMGVVYEAWESSMNRRVALKVMPKAVAVDTRAVARFIQEAQLAGKLSHPNIVHIHGMGVKEQVPYYAMDFVEGETLAQILVQLKDLEPEAETTFGKKGCAGYFENIARAFADVADGLQHAHAHKIIHRDIKPSNLILDGEGRLRILDFGLARLEGQESLTISGALIGTPLYMSPEQAQRKKIDIDYRTDIYSLGATLYEMLTLVPPFRGKDHADTLSQIIERDPPRPSGVNPRLSRDIETIVLKCLRKDAGDRYGTAEALAQDLRRFVRGDAVEAKPRPVWERTFRRAWRSRGKLAAALCVLFLLVLSGLLLQDRLARLERGRQDLYREKVLGAVLKLELGLSEGGAPQGAARYELGLHERFLRAVDLDVARRSRPVETLESAVAELDEAIKILPRRADALYHRARARWLLGQHGDAIRDLDRALSLAPGLASAVNLHAALVPAGGDARSTHSGDGGDDDPWLEAHRATIESRWADAARSYTRVIEQESASGESLLGSLVEAHLTRGSAYLRAREFERAVEDFAVVEHLLPGALEPSLLKGEAYYLLQKKQHAEEIFEEIFARSGSPDLSALWIAGLYSFFHEDVNTLLLEHGQFEEAAKLARRLLATHPEDTRVRSDRAFALIAQDRIQEGVEECREAIRRNPKAAFAHWTLGIAFVLQGRMAEALEMFEEEIQLRPGDASVPAGIAGELGQFGKWEEAAELCRRAIALAPQSADAYASLGLALLRQGKHKEAQEAYEKSITMSPNNADTYCGLGKLFCLQGKFEEAKRALGRAIEINGDFALAHSEIGFILLKEGTLDEAAQRFRQAQAIDRDYAGSYFGLGLVLKEEANFEEAESQFRAAARLRAARDWWAALPRYHLGLVLEMRGRPEPAIEELCLALECNPRMAEAQEKLCALLRRRGDVSTSGAFHRALEALERETETNAGHVLPELMARLLLHAPARRDLDGALTWALRAATRSDPPTPGSVEVLQLVLGALRDERLPGEHPLAVLKSLPVCSVLQAVIDAEPASDAQQNMRLVARFRSLAETAEEAPRLAFLEASLLEEEGRYREAAELLSRALSIDAANSEIVLGRARCLRRSGEAAAAERVLREAIAGGIGGRGELWELWAVVSFVDLKRSAAQILREIPDVSPGCASANNAGDLRWLLGELSAGKRLRINCGGDDVACKDGSQWSRDRFALGGRVASPFAGEIAASDAAEVYKTHRWFTDDGSWAGYRFPLPPGRYRVALHFAETWFRRPGLRRFDVLIQGKEVLKDFEPLSGGFAIAGRKVCETMVEGGILAIEFAHGLDNPVVSAIEIERVD